MQAVLPPTASSCLGKRLHLSALLFERKFHGQGNKTAALEALHQLETAGLGKLEMEKSHRGTAAVSISSWFTFQSCCSLGFILSGVHPTSPSFLTITVDMNDILFILYSMSCVYATRLSTVKVSTVNADRPQQRWTRQLLRGSGLLSRPSTLKLASLPLASGASLHLALCARPPPPPSPYAYVDAMIYISLLVPPGHVLATYTYLFACK